MTSEPADRHPADAHLVMTNGAAKAFDEMIKATTTKALTHRMNGENEQAHSILASALASTTAMIRLGGRLIGSEFNGVPGIEGYADRLGISYGVVLHRDFSWSVNS